MDETDETAVRPRLSVQSGRVEEAEKEQEVHIDVVQIAGHRLIAFISLNILKIAHRKLCVHTTS